MGQWYLIVKGSGFHHTGNPEDVDALGKGFVEQLLKSGSQVEHAFLDIVNIEGEVIDPRTDLLGPVRAKLTGPSPLPPAPVVEEPEVLLETADPAPLT